MYDQIAEVLKDSWNSERVVIEGDTVRTDMGWKQWIPAYVLTDAINRLIPFLDTDTFADENRQTMSRLHELCGGRRRVERISKRYGLDLEYKFAHGLAVTRYDIEVLFAGMGDVHLIDLQELLWTIRSDRHDALHEHFYAKDFESLTKADFDLLYARAVPFDDLSTMFLHNIPTIDANEQDRGAYWEGTKRRIYMVEEMRRSPSTPLAELIRKVKRIYDYHIPQGLVLPGAEGYHVAFKRLEAGGCYAWLLKSLTPDECPNLVTTLGTQFFGYVPYPWESGAEDLRNNIGALGARSIYYDLLYYLSDPNAGFVSHPDEKIDLAGMSLGGAQAERIATLFPDRVRRLQAVCNPGVDVATYERFAEKVNEMAIEYFWECDDIVSLGGDGHIGLGCDPEKVRVTIHMLSPADFEHLDFPNRPEKPEGVINSIWAVWDSLFGPHTRETTAEIYKSPDKACYLDHIADNQYDPDHVQALLKNGEWEEFRKYFAFGSEKEFISFLDRIQRIA